MVGNAGSWQGVIEHWDGRTWSVARLLEDAPTALLGLRAVTSDDVWAAGNSNNGPLVEHWDGRAWTRVSTPVAAAAGQGLDAVDALPNGDLWAAGDQAVAGRWATLVERVCPIKVTDDGFLPPTTKAGLGLTTVWQLPTTNAAAQAVADATGMTQFDSGTRAPGGSFVYPFAAAGTYTVSDPVSGYSSKVKVPVSAPGSATVRQPFTVKWASTPATTGFVFDVQIRPPGAAAWSAWRTGATTTSAAYVGSVAGSYQFRARLRKSGVASSGYSPAITVTVG
jgi:hypothetical protein